MQDFDFDEIDRAVSSSIKPTPKTDDNSVSVNVSRPQPAVQDTPPAARRSSGRFMDVVHPSSDMRSASPPERSAPRAPEPPKTDNEPPKVHTDWPDPLDFHGFKDDEPKSDPEPVETKADEPTKPLESPFLSDAKVEKRPLGAFSTNDAPEELPTPEEKAPEPPKPAKEPEEELLLEASDEELLPAETETKEAEEPEAVAEPEPTPAPEDEPIGPTSITQQYKEQPSTTDQPSGAIFDTEAYHQPLAHPEKKKSGALIIVWIVALILLGAGVGAGVYFFVLPML